MRNKAQYCLRMSPAGAQYMQPSNDGLNFCQFYLGPPLLACSEAQHRKTAPGTSISEHGGENPLPSRVTCPEPVRQHLQVSWHCSRISAVEATAKAAPLIFKCFVSISVPLQLRLLIFLSTHFISACNLIKGACVWESSFVQTCF